MCCNKEMYEGNKRTLLLTLPTPPFGSKVVQRADSFNSDAPAEADRFAARSGFRWVGRGLGFRGFGLGPKAALNCRSETKRHNHAPTFRRGHTKNHLAMSVLQGSSRCISGSTNLCCFSGGRWHFFPCCYLQRRSCQAQYLNFKFQTMQLRSSPLWRVLAVRTRF